MYYKKCGKFFGRNMSFHFLFWRKYTFRESLPAKSLPQRLSRCFAAVNALLWAGSRYGMRIQTRDPGVYGLIPRRNICGRWGALGVCGRVLTTSSLDCEFVEKQTSDFKNLCPFLGFFRILAL